MDRSSRPGDGANAFRFTVNSGYGLDYGMLTRWLPPRAQGIAAVILIHGILVLLALAAPSHQPKPAKAPVLTYLTIVSPVPPKSLENIPARTTNLQPVSPSVPTVTPPVVALPAFSAPHPAPLSYDSQNAACQRHEYGIPLPADYACPERWFIPINPAAGDKQAPAKKPTEQEIEAAREARFNALKARFGPKETQPVGIDNDRVPMIASQSWQKTEQWKQEYLGETAPLVKKVEEEVLPDIILRDKSSDNGGNP